MTIKGKTKTVKYHDYLNPKRESIRETIYGQTQRNIIVKTHKVRKVKGSRKSNRR